MSGAIPPLPRTPGGPHRFFKAYTQGLTIVAGRLLESTGWAPDGASRELDADGVALAQRRWATTLLGLWTIVGGRDYGCAGITAWG